MLQALGAAIRFAAAEAPQLLPAADPVMSAISEVHNLSVLAAGSLRVCGGHSGQSHTLCTVSLLSTCV